MQKILIIDPDQRDTGRLVRELEKQGFRFSACPVRTLDGLRASLEGGRPDLILSETKICGADGFRALEIVRECDPGVPFIFVSQTHDPGLIVEIFENGGNGHISKHDLSELREVILQAQHSCLKPLAGDGLPDTPVSTTSDSSCTTEGALRTTSMVKPICPRCKRIGESDEDWQPVEIHLRLHGQATVCLGTCPDCAEALVRM